MSVRGSFFVSAQVSAPERKRKAGKVTKKARKSRRTKKRPRLAPKQVLKVVDELFGEDFHAKRVLSLAMGVVGVLHAASLAIHAIGRGLAAARGLDPKHATKQVDRLLSNSAIHMDRILRSWIQFVVGERKQLVVALDWTEFDKDDQAVIALYLVTSHGRATPLVWKSVLKSSLAGKRADYETSVIDLLGSALPKDVDIILLADRGFGEVARYANLDTLGWGYVIRFREGIHVTHDGETKTARAWMHKSGRARLLRNVEVTNAREPVGAVVVVRQKKMKDAWCLATNRAELSASQIINLYGRRFTIEETFRDTKDVHFGMGLSATHIGSTARRDRLLLLGALAHALLTLLGAAGERCGLDSRLKVSTTKRRTLSLYRQGCFWYDAIPAMKKDRLGLLMTTFDEVVREQRVFREVFGII